MSTIRFPFKGLFGQIAAAFKRNKPQFTEHHKPPVPKAIIPDRPERRWALVEWLRMPKYHPRNIIPGGKELMLRLAQEKRERRRARNRRLAGIA